MTRLIDTHIPVYYDPKRPIMNSAYHYLAHVAWPHLHEQAERDRFVGELLAAHYKIQPKARHVPTSLPRSKYEAIATISERALRRICGRRIPAFRMLVHHFMQAGLIDPPARLTPKQRMRLLELNATKMLVDPYGDLLGEGRIFLSERADSNLDNIHKDIWQDSRPTLAMLSGLWPLRVFGRGGFIEIIDDMGQKPAKPPIAIAAKKKAAIAPSSALSEPTYA